jgi:hypothetical protein
MLCLLDEETEEKMNPAGAAYHFSRQTPPVQAPFRHLDGRFFMSFSALPLSAL